MSKEKKGILKEFKEMLGLDSPNAGADIDSNDELDFEKSGITEIEIKKNTPVEKNKKINIKNNPKNKEKSSLEHELGANNNYQTIFLDPKSFYDAHKIVDYVRDDKMITLNLEYLDEETSIRLMNFLSGAMTVKEANYLMISKKVYTIVPKSMKVYYEDKKIINPNIFVNFND